MKSMIQKVHASAHFLCKVITKIDLLTLQPNRMLISVTMHQPHDWNEHGLSLWPNSSLAARPCIGQRKSCCIMQHDVTYGITYD